MTGAVTPTPARDESFASYWFTNTYFGSRWHGAQATFGRTPNKDSWSRSKPVLSLVSNLYEEAVHSTTLTLRAIYCGQQ
jgi:hypothetical protein